MDCMPDENRVLSGHGKSWSLRRPLSRPAKWWKIAKASGRSHGKWWYVT